MSDDLIERLRAYAKDWAVRAADEKPALEAANRIAALTRERDDLAAELRGVIREAEKSKQISIRHAAKLTAELEAAKARYDDLDRTSERELAECERERDELAKERGAANARIERLREALRAVEYTREDNWRGCCAIAIAALNADAKGE